MKCEEICLHVRNSYFVLFAAVRVRDLNIRFHFRVNIPRPYSSNDGPDLSSLTLCKFATALVEVNSRLGYAVEQSQHNQIFY
ncbi:unnamed protein product [Macrosiphum euphorbiae]|uniref:Uncharacterized protein n=1 Tax=Macrosiphum euphorbiae TaxID=13131 RepID=A0AAV0VWQ7_9HEMI|nr:unnamed protein product [Macrosiphum euphorbiae]